MLNILVKKQLGEIFRSYTYDAKKNRARSKGATIGFTVLFVVLMVGVLGGLFTFVSLAMCDAMASAGLDWLYFTLMTLLAAFLGIFGSVFNTYSSLYMAKDNDLLLSLPIPVRTIMAARLVSVYLMGLMYSAVVYLPCLIVYWVVVGITVKTALGGILLLALLSLFVLTLSCALGWIVAKVSRKLRNKSFITVLVSLVFIGAYYFFYAQAGDLLQELLANAAQYGESIRSGAYPLYLVGRVAVGDGGAMAMVTAVVLALFALVWWLIARSFLKLATSTGTVAKKEYREKTTRRRSADAALLGRELSRFTASANYMLNCGMGILGMVIGAGALVWKGGSFLPMLEPVFASRPGALSVLLCAALCTLVGMNDMAAPSVSLEGKSLWLAQSLPVTAWQVLRAKLRMHLLLTAVPAALCGICVAVVSPAGAAQTALALVVAALFTVLSALLNLFLGLKMPNLHWVSETTPIKQGGAVALALLGGVVYAALLAAGFFLIGWRMGYMAFMAAFAVVTLAACVLLLRWIKTKGCAVFAAL